MTSIHDLVACMTRLRKEARARFEATTETIVITRGVPSGSVMLLHSRPREIRISAEDAMRFSVVPNPTGAVKYAFMGVPVRWES